MWLLPLIDQFSAVAAHAFYRLTVAGGRVPKDGPVLLVANHPNSLFDPALVAVAARRPVRFLAKAPLLKDRAIGWMVRGAAAIPVYRPSDDPSLVSLNDESFRAAHQELAAGAAIGIFPEGISHSQPGVVPPRTGAARIALGAAALRGGFPIIPIGLVLRDKARFRSEALVVVGDPVPWDDLVAREAGGESAAVRELTARIHRGLRQVTVNYESWEDAPLVEGAATIYAAEFGVERNPLSRAGVAREVSETLARLRREGDARWQPLAHDVARHLRTLETFGFTPAGLRVVPTAGQAAWWTLRHLAYFLVPGALAAIGVAIFYLPYRLVALVVGRLRPSPDLVATYYTLGGALVMGLWILLLAGAAAVLAGWWTALALLLLLPAIGVLTIVVRDRWRAARADLRRFFRLRTRGELRQLFAARQREIAERLRALHAAIHA